MTSGGARNRRNKPDMASQNSLRKGLAYERLPNEGYAGEIPAYPLARVDIYRDEIEDKVKTKVLDQAATKAFRKRELALWRKIWRYPQASAWAREPWRWDIVAMWVRTYVTCEGDNAVGADKTNLHRFGDQIGLTPAGLKENGWTVVTDELGPRRDEGDTGTSADAPTSARDRMKAASGGGS